jgi:putative SOS response-associated peptidase YedK
MCFSVNVNIVKEELEKRYKVTFLDPEKYSPSYYYHAFGLPELPVVCSGNAQVIRMMRWGLIPSWIRSITDADKIRYKTFNARSETIEVKPSFSQSVKSKRCIIPVKGFFEWQHRDDIKIPWYIYHSGSQIISLAGLYNYWTESVSGEMIYTFTVITTEANRMMAEIHNSGKRMPAIIQKEDESKWLDISSEPEEIIKLLRPSTEEYLKAHTIGPLVNRRNADKNTPELIRPYEYGSGASLFQ